MSNSVHQTILDYWNLGAKVKRSPSGWLTRNGVCCQHRGERPDSKGRAGLITDSNKITINCFNCGFSTAYTIGGPISLKLQQLLKWLGADDAVISKLKIETLRTDTAFTAVPKQTNIIHCSLPEGAELLAENKEHFPEHVKYVEDRGLDINCYPFMATKINGKASWSKRIILPFMKNGQLIGYTGRGLKNIILPKYINKMTSPYVFGIDLQEPNWNWIILNEGPFDALSIDGLAVLHNEISDEQCRLINSLQKQIIVVPDYDAAGLKNDDNNFIPKAIKNNWYVSFPDWDGLKDINAATKEYGRLFVIKSIFDNATNNPTTIKVKQKLLQSKINIK